MSTPGPPSDPKRQRALELRNQERKQRLVAHRSRDFEEAEAWDLDYWQAHSPEERLSALVAIHRDVELAERAKRESLASEDEKLQRSMKTDPSE
ncbi:MAG: hypothetical protein K8J08_10245 [Thermoanaerobaculia bacterium]|nr:hypothetical protein [Thermoanaerobaculia bacterium]